jgi:hypothetical protein
MDQDKTGEQLRKPKQAAKSATDQPATAAADTGSATAPEEDVSAHVMPPSALLGGDIWRARDREIKRDAERTRLEKEARRPSKPRGRSQGRA